MRAAGGLLAALFTCAFATFAEESDPPSPSELAAERRRASAAAIQRGLDWLAREQLPCGGWVGDVGHKREDDYLLFDDARLQRLEDRGHVGVSALAGLAFLAAGNEPGRGRRAETLDRAIRYVLDHSNEYGYLSDSGTRMYSHAFATLFLSEVEGSSSPLRKEIHATLAKAAQFIVDTQNAHGAWRYSPFTTEADISVTVCQVQALRAARDVGIHVPYGAIERVIEYVKESRIEGGELEGAFYYKIHGSSARSKTSYAINAAAVTTLHCSGVYDDAEYGRAVRFLEDEYDAISRHYPDHFYFWYGNWYAAQAMNHVGGERFERYYAKLEADLLDRQLPDGRWRNDIGPGDTFATAVACILLALPDQYLRILQR